MKKYLFCLLALLSVSAYAQKAPQDARVFRPGAVGQTVTTLPDGSVGRTYDAIQDFVASRNEAYQIGDWVRYTGADGVTRVYEALLQTTASPDDPVATPPGASWVEALNSGGTPEGYVFSTTAPKKGERWIDTTPGANELYDVKVFNGTTWEVIEYYDDTNGLFSKEKPLHILVVGQSNTMNGFAGASIKNDSRVTFFNVQTNTWEIADLEGNLYVPGKVNYPGTHLSYQNATGTAAFPVDFASRLADHTGRNVRLITSSHGGNPIENWTDNANRPNWDVLAAQMAINGVSIFDGVIFHQGESNSSWGTHTPVAPATTFDSLTYSNNLAKLRLDLNQAGWYSYRTPFVVGETSATRSSDVNVVLDAFARANEFVGIVRGKNLPTTEGTHFDGNSKKVQGSRYFEKFLSLPHVPGILSDDATESAPDLNTTMSVEGEGVSINGKIGVGYSTQPPSVFSVTGEEAFEPLVTIENTITNQANGIYTLHIDNSAGGGGDDEGGLLIEGGGTSYMKYNSRGQLILKSRSPTAYDPLTLEDLRTTSSSTSMLVETSGQVRKRDISTFPLFPIGSGGADLSDFTTTTDANNIGTGLTLTSSTTLNAPASGMLYTSRFNADVTNQMHQQLVTGLLRTRAKHPSNSGDTWTSWTAVGIDNMGDNDAGGNEVTNAADATAPTSLTTLQQVNALVSSAGPAVIGDLTDVDVTTAAPANDDILGWDALTSTWKPTTKEADGMGDNDAGGNPVTNAADATAATDLTTFQQISRGIAVTVTTDANGAAVIPHSFGTTPTAITVSPRGPDYRYCQVTSRAAINFAVKVFLANGAPAANVSFIMEAIMTFE